MIRSVDPVPVEEAGRSWLMPSFANPHVHLELSGLRGEELSGATFAGWVRGLVGRRRGATTADVADAVAAGWRRLLETGTTAVGDIDSLGIAAPVLAELGAEGVVYREVLGRPDASVWDAFLAQRDSWSAPHLRLGLSPHAPYSTPPETYDEVARLARSHGIPVATHVGETLEERQLLRSGDGPLAELLTSWGLEAPSWPEPADGLVARAVRRLEGCDVLWIHANHLEAVDVAALEEHPGSVVVCPGTHAYFGHPTPHPARRFGARLLLGTDSLASNDDLDLWSELRRWAATHPGTDGHEALTAATRRARRALGLEEAELRVGEMATFQRVDAPPDGEEFAAWAVRGGGRTRATCLRGRWVVDDRSNFGDR